MEPFAAHAWVFTAIYFALQPAFYTSKDTCLRTSLTLLEFLAHYDVYPSCILA